MTEAMSSSESYKAQMSKELEVLHEVCRSLSEMDGHHGRELLGFLAGFVIVFYGVWFLAFALFGNGT